MEETVLYDFFTTLWHVKAINSYQIGSAREILA